MKFPLKIRLLTLGRPKKGYVSKAVADYLTRIERYAFVELLELKDVAGKKSKPETLIREEETARLFSAIPANALKIALDERGKQFSSVELADFLNSCLNQNRYHLCFIIGGEVGLSESFRQKMDLVWSLSKLTFPHDLARVLVLEQLYRALTILSGQAYHK